MKKNNFLKFLFACFCIAPNFFFAQFNTITPLPVKKETTSNYFEKERESRKEEPKEIKTKKPKKSKSDIKSELDSLKMMMLQYTLKKNNETSLNYKKIEDSIVGIFQKKYLQKKTDLEFKKMDLLEEPNESYSFSKIYMPLKQLNITSRFGGRSHPIFGVYKMHSGIDLAASYENVYSVLDGIVTEAGWDPKGGGNYIKVNHSGRFETSYLHLSNIYYRVGESVKAGWIIAKSGNTGNSTGPHLHFGVKEFGSYINPTKFLNDLVKVNNLITIQNEKQLVTNR